MGKTQKNAFDTLQDLQSEVNVLKDTITQIVASVQKGFDTVQNRTAALQEILGATAKLLGETEVRKVIEEGRKVDDEANVKAQQEQVAKAIAEGVLTLADKVTARSLIVGVETDAAGVAIRPGRHQLKFAEVQPQFQESFLGQSVGFSVETPSGGKYTVTEVYDINVPKESVTPESIGDAMSPELAAQFNTQATATEPAAVTTPAAE